jgi:GNAT superfamily N-acetyltransferase
MPDQPQPEIRVERATDPERFLATDQLVWFGEPGSESTEMQLRDLPVDQRFYAEVVGADGDPATYPGIYGVLPMQLAVPDGRGAGRLVPVAGLTWVGVHPDHRRRGLLTAMLRHHFEQTRAEGLHLSGLHASEPAIYGRHGYGLASLEQSVDLGRGTTFTAPHLDDEAAALTTTFGAIGEDDMAARRRACDLAVAEEGVGTIVGDADFYWALCHDRPEDLRDKEPGRIIFATRDGVDVGYAVLRRTHKWPNARPSAKVEVHQLSGGPAARLALLRRLVDLDLAGTVSINGIGQDDPLLSWLDGPRATGDIHPYDSLWVRLVDLPAALAARGYDGDDCDVVIEVADEAVPSNAGRWRIRVAGGEAEATRSEDDAEVTMPIAALGAAYLGGAGLAARARAGTIAEHRPGAARELSRAFRTDLPPYAARGF